MRMSTHYEKTCARHTNNMHTYVAVIALLIVMTGLVFIVVLIIICERTNIQAAIILSN
jgi:cytochrome c oxidase assembly protein Cox11